MPESAEQSAERKALARRAAVDTLKIASAIADYAASAIGDGLSPEAARRATLDAAGELEITAASLRRLVLGRLSPAERRALAVGLAADGLTVRQIAAQVGRSERQVQDYLRGRA